jgi:hypothetical protein
MARVLLGLVLIVAVVAGLGFYMGWFHLSSSSDDNSAHVTVSVDKVQDLGQQAKDEVATTTRRVPD